MSSSNFSAARERVIVALDGISSADALRLAAELRGAVWGFKVNDLLAEYGVQIVRDLKKLGSVFADPKFHDIPNTVANGVKRLNAAGADLITVHASGGGEMLKAAATAAGSSKILAVTVLTSLTDDATKEIYKQSVGDTVPNLARLAMKSGCYGIVCSPNELELLNGHKDLAALKRVTPGVRPGWHGKADDQSRVAAPAEAVRRGASLLVVGRPITEHPDPREACRLLDEELAGV